MDSIPARFNHTIDVPGLVTTARPLFSEAGLKSNLREAFWYRKTFRINGEIPASARLKIYKSMYGTRVILNGKEIGYNPLNFVPLYFNIKPFLKGNGIENELIIRIGAFIDACEDTVVTGGDPERHSYPPGIYDRVEVILSGNPFILRAQVAPDIKIGNALIAVTIANSSDQQERLGLKANIFDYSTGKLSGSADLSSVVINPKSNKTVEVIVPVEKCKLWTPESPNLYVLQITDGEYSYYTRFGMRTFSVDPEFPNRALLNGKPYFMRGTNIALARFFEDPLCKSQPWDKSWVRKLVCKFTTMEMNAARFCISQAPEMWYDVADEEGFIVFDEYPIWYAYQPKVGDVAALKTDTRKKYGIYPEKLTSNHLVNEYTQWMESRWNHASTLVWDAQNETWSDQIKIAINKVRSLDLSGRSWDNGWSPPAGPRDIRETHAYFENYTQGTEQKQAKEKKAKPFSLSDLYHADKIGMTFYLPYQHAFNELPLNWYWEYPCVLNEYCYLWLNRDGMPTTLTRPFYEAVLGPNPSPNQCRELYAHYLAAITEYWRANRTNFAILYPFGLGYSRPGGETSDNWVNVDSLTFDPYFEKYVPSAFAALGLCIEWWDEEYTMMPESDLIKKIDIPVIIINDLPQPFMGYLFVRLLKGDKVVFEKKRKYEVTASGIERIYVAVDMPQTEPGDCTMIAELQAEGRKPVFCYRPFKVIKNLREK